MSDIPVEVATTQTAPATDKTVTAEPTTTDTMPAALSPLEAMKADFDKVVAFIEHGIEVLGEDAEADLVALKNKFLI
ncbi:Ig domain protein group 1 domain protein [Prodigiosinella confusarubida]|uniref:Ig domain protein group 1 domain protein n=1 Tax=Serratia sp. (strain ATCC 39006) TaxID=104623 RepID=A0A800UGR9_SERS3|nr:Ig domain protein group 1 domain protein [Serratia sp. ATCC 39006]AUG99737.1 Ig domain protein group 1 domain protein [Serratia sp. ATCC 39006]